MKKYFLFVVAFTYLCLCWANAQVESESAEKFLFFDKLTSSGAVTVHQDPRLIQIMATRASENKKKGDKDFIQTSGFRVQIYSSNAPKISKDEAFRLEAEVKEKFSDVGTYISFSSPFWRVRVGDCKTQQEANVLLEALKKEFPDIRDRFYVVKDEVRIPIR